MDDFSIEACRESVKFYIETLHNDPLTLLGKWELRSKQDMFFNKSMIDALYSYIAAKGIKWDD